jgi:hypothetical protein
VVQGATSNPPARVQGQILWAIGLPFAFGLASWSLFAAAIGKYVVQPGTPYQVLTLAAAGALGWFLWRHPLVAGWSFVTGEFFALLAVAVFLDHPLELAGVLFLYLFFTFLCMVVALLIAFARRKLSPGTIFSS